MAPRSRIFSIFGEIESVVAQQMIDQGRATYIAPDRIPDSERFNDFGTPARFAVVIPGNLVREFNTRIATLRA